MNEEVRVTSETGGQKGSKPVQLAWIDPFALEELGRVAGKGAEKYAAHNYRKGYPVSLSINAAWRHLLKAQAGEDVDDETKCYHFAMAAWQCLAALSILHDHPEFDDRHHDRDKGLQDRELVEYLQGAVELVTEQIERGPARCRCCRTEVGGRHVLGCDYLWCDHSIPYVLDHQCG